jgi:hypothetical protein
MQQACDLDSTIFKPPGPLKSSLHRRSLNYEDCEENFRFAVSFQPRAVTLGDTALYRGPSVPGVNAPGYKRPSYNAKSG